MYDWTALRQDVNLYDRRTQQLLQRRLGQVAVVPSQGCAHLVVFSGFIFSGLNSNTGTTLHETFFPNFPTESGSLTVNPGLGLLLLSLLALPLASFLNSMLDTVAAPRVDYVGYGTTAYGRSLVSRTLHMNT